MQKKHVSFNKRVFLALIVGIVFGLVLQFTYGTTSKIITESAEWIKIVGSGSISLLKMLVIPLVFFAILSAFTKSKLSKDFGKIGGLVILGLAVTVAISGGLGILSASIFQLEEMDITQGKEESIAIVENEDTLGEMEEMSIQDKIQITYSRI